MQKRVLSAAFVIVAALNAGAVASAQPLVHGHAPCPAGLPACSSLPPLDCISKLAGYSSCVPVLGPAKESGEDANLGYDISPATGNLFLAQADIFVHPALGPELAFVRYYNSQSNGVNAGLGPNWTHTYSWSITISGNSALIVADTGRVIQFTDTGTVWVPENGEFGSLKTAGSSKYVYTNKYGTSYLFDSLGRLKSIQPADSPRPIVISYSSGNQIRYVASASSRLRFSYSGARIVSVSDPAGATWIYGYLPAILPGLATGARAALLGKTVLTQSKSTLGLLQTVTIPNGNVSTSAVHGMTLYAYGSQVVGNATFSSGDNGTATLTGYGAITGADPVGYRGTTPLPQNNVTEVILGLFSYSHDRVPKISEAAGGVVAGQLLRNLQFAYTSPVPGLSLVTTIGVNGGIKTLTSQFVDALHPRLVSVTSTAGVGARGEMQNEGWIWNGDLTLAEHVDGNGIKTVFGAYDIHGNPGTTIEAFGTNLQRTKKITWHAVLSRPLSVTTDSIADETPGCLNFPELMCRTHELIWDYDAPVGGQFSNNYNTSPTNYLYQIVEIGYTNTGAGNLSAPSGVISRVPEVHSIQIQRDSNKRVFSIAGPVPGQLLTKAYSPTSGLLSTVTRSVDGSRSLSASYSGYDGDGRVTGVTDANGNVTSTTYDLAGRVTGKNICASDGSSCSYERYTLDLAENVIGQVSPDGAIATDLDDGFRPWRIRASGTLGPSWSRVSDFDSFGRPLTTRIFSGGGVDEGVGCAPDGTETRCTEIYYDSYERPVTTHTLGPTNSMCPLPGCANYYQYDGNGNVIVGPGDLSTNVTYTIDALNRVTSTVDKNHVKSTVQYDVNDNVIVRDDGRDSKNGGTGGNARDVHYWYDDFGRMVKIISQDIGTWINSYDSADNVSSSQDNAGAVLFFTYDLLNRKTSTTSGTSRAWQDVGTYFFYDFAQIAPVPGTRTSNQGQLTGITAFDIHGNRMVSSFDYDFRGRMTKDTEQRIIGATQQYSLSTTYDWDPASRQLRSITYPDGLVVTRQHSGAYGPRPRISEIDVPFNGSKAVPIVSNVVYSADGEIASYQSNSGSTTTMTRNKRGELTDVFIAPRGWFFGLAGLLQDRVPIWQEHLDFMSGSDIGRVSDVSFFGPYSNGWHWNLGYDPVGRLTSWTTDEWGSATSSRKPGTQFNWAYDEVGNRTSQTYNALIPSAGTVVLHPGNGQINHSLRRDGFFYWKSQAGVISTTPGNSIFSYNANGSVSSVTPAPSVQSP